MAAAGVSGPKAAQIAALNSRQSKGTYDETALKAEWKDRAEAEGIDAKAHLRTALSRGNGFSDHNGEAGAAIAFATSTQLNEKPSLIGAWSKPQPCSTRWGGWI
jgi:hypothetical protein